MQLRILILIALAISIGMSAPALAATTLAWTTPAVSGHPDASPTQITVINDPRPMFVRSEYGVGMWVFAYGASLPYASCTYENFIMPWYAADFDGDGHQEIVFSTGNEETLGGVGVYDVSTRQVEASWPGDTVTSYSAYWISADYNSDGRTDLVLEYDHDNGNGTYTSEIRVYTFSPTGTVSTDELSSGEPQGIVAWPNPTTGQVRFSGLRPDTDYSLYDVGGRRVFGPFRGSVQQLTRLSGGLLHLRADSDHGVGGRKIVLIK